MLAPTHSVFGLFITLIILAAFGIQISLHWTVMVVAVIGAILPDIDHPKSLIGKLFPFISNPLERKFGHRTFTHSFLGALVFIGLFVLFILAYNIILYGIHLAFAQPYLGLQLSNIGLAIRWVAAFGIGFASHLCLDMFNKQGSQLLWPNTGRDVIPKNIKYRLESGSKAELASLRTQKASLIQKSHKIRNEDDGLTALGRKVYGNTDKESERQTKLAELKSQIGEIDVRIQAIALRMKAHEFLYTGEVKVRESLSM